MPSGSWVNGRTLADCAFRKADGVTVIAILRESESIAGAQPDDVILDGDTIVVVGKAGQFSTVRALLADGPGDEESRLASSTRALKQQRAPAAPRDGRPTSAAPSRASTNR